MERKEKFSSTVPSRPELSDNPVKLCNEIARLFRNRMRSLEGQEGVMSQPGAHLVLAMLAIHDGINQLELVRATHLKPPTVSVILKNMEAEGLVERRSDPQDLRATRVYLTEDGRRLDGESIARIRAMDAYALKGLSEEECQILMPLLIRIRNNLLWEDEEEARK